MGDGTLIDWCDATWNPIRGCSPLSAGCANCYARRMARRFYRRGQAFAGLTDSTGEWTGEVRVIEEKMNLPISWHRARVIFVNSVSDVFHPNLPDEAALRIFRVMCEAYRLGRCHTYIILTKRPERMRAFMRRLSWTGLDLELGHVECEVIDPLIEGLVSRIWLMVSVENQKALDERLPILRSTPALVRGLSVEPMLGPINMRGRLEGIHWVICGCESGPDARPMDLDWARSLRDQCVEAGVPFFLKQIADGDGHFIKMPRLDGQVWDQRPPIDRTGDRALLWQLPGL